MMKKIIVAHPNRQHSFKLATALKNDGILFKYITTVYDKESSLMMKITKKIIKGNDLKRANGRRCENLNDEDIIQFCEIGGFIELLLMRIDKSKKIYTWWNRRLFDKFGKKVAMYAISNNVDAVIMYDSTAQKCFEILKKRAPHIKRIMDSSTANRQYIKALFEEEIQKTSDDSYLLENDYLWDKLYMNKMEKEINDTQHYLVPSKFVKDSFIFSNVNSECIHIIPYGSNITTSYEDKNNEKYDILKFLYVGQVTPRKGIDYLLEAFEEVKNENIELTIVGRISDKYKYISENNDSKIIFKGEVTHDCIKEIYKQSHVFVFPSILEGMTLSGLEALGCGLPVICTTNTGINDIIEDGKNGFVINASNSNEIVNKIKWFINNKNKINEMRKNAYKTSTIYTWENYNQKMASEIKEICK